MYPDVLNLIKYEMNSSQFMIEMHDAKHAFKDCFLILNKYPDVERKKTLNKITYAVEYMKTFISKGNLLKNIHFLFFGYMKCLKMFEYEASRVKIRGRYNSLIQ